MPTLSFLNWAQPGPERYHDLFHSQLESWHHVFEIHNSVRSESGSMEPSRKSLLEYRLLRHTTPYLQAIMTGDDVTSDADGARFKVAKAT